MSDDVIERLADETTLSDRQAQVVVGRIEGATFHEIADELGISTGTANKAWQRAKEKAATAKQSTELFEEIGLV